MEPNLLVTYAPTHAAKARKEIEELTGNTVAFLESSHDGVFLLLTKRDPKAVVAEMTRKCEEEPYLFNSTFRWIPIERWSDTEMEEMKKAARDVSEGIEPRDSWKIGVGKRSFGAETPVLIKELTENIDKPNVDLRNPSRILAVEIIGNKAGFSLLRPEEYLSVTRTKME